MLCLGGLQRRAWWAALGGAVLWGLAACESRPVFQGVDITGAEYAQALRLPDQHGQVRQLSDFKGKVVVLFFGYTQCPDVCPTSLGELAHAKRLLGPDGERLQAVFVSVDPERDRPEIMQAYMESFDPSFVALLPTLQELPAVAKAFKVYYKKVPGRTPETYTMDHSAGSYLYDPQGRLRVYHRYGAGASALAADAKTLLQPAP